MSVDTASKSGLLPLPAAVAAVIGVRAVPRLLCAERDVHTRTFEEGGDGGLLRSPKGHGPRGDGAGAGSRAYAMRTRPRWHTAQISGSRPVSRW